MSSPKDRDRPSQWKSVIFQTFPSVLWYNVPAALSATYLVPLTITSSGHFHLVGPRTYAVPLFELTTPLVFIHTDPPTPAISTPFANHFPPPHTNPIMPSAVNQFASVSSGGSATGNLT
ncbi:MAG: hypothetical protein L6R36_007108 [Xanthoria steineri]|nr:MAG: hypothetical protein L6R36_007108 [Xanthoria steineri]